MFLGIAVLFVTIVMWFSALLTARVPEGMWRFSKGVYQWTVRTLAYEYFLTDRYPPFQMGDAAYPVSMTLERPDRFNRLAVLFRVFLVIPAAIVATAFTWGASWINTFTWIITLVIGRCPRPLHLVLAASLRYQLRYSAYYSMLTTEYPSAPLGDHRTSYGSLEAGELVLEGGSKALGVIVIVVGAVGYLASSLFAIALPTVLHTRATTSTAIAQWSALQSRATAAEAQFQTRAATCAPATWSCVASDMSILEGSLRTQISSIEKITFPTTTTRHEAGAVLSLLRSERAGVVQIHDAGTPQAFTSALQHVVTLTHRLQPIVLKLDSELVAATS